VLRVRCGALGVRAFHAGDLGIGLLGHTVVPLVLLKHIAGIRDETAGVVCASVLDIRVLLHQPVYHGGWVLETLVASCIVL
jgi:hypothetical protein